MPSQGRPKTKWPKNQKNKTGVKVEIILEQREVAFKICENLKFSREIQSSQILLGDKNTTYPVLKLYLL